MADTRNNLQTYMLTTHIKEKKTAEGTAQSLSPLSTSELQLYFAVHVRGEENVCWGVLGGRAPNQPSPQAVPEGIPSYGYLDCE